MRAPYLSFGLNRISTQPPRIIVDKRRDLSGRMIDWLIADQLYAYIYLFKEQFYNRDKATSPVLPLAE